MSTKKNTYAVELYYMDCEHCKKEAKRAVQNAECFKNTRPKVKVNMRNHVVTVITTEELTLEHFEEIFHPYGLRVKTILSNTKP